jgi:hypothetical protein
VNVLASLPVGWWTFWLGSAAALFVALVWVVTRLAVDSDEEERHGPHPGVHSTEQRKEPL